MNDFNSYGGYNSNNNNYNNNQVNYNGNTTGYADNQYSYGQNQAGFSDNQNSFGYNNNQSGFNQNQTGYTDNQSGYNQNIMGYTNSVPNYNNQVQSGYNNYQSAYNQGAFGIYPSQPSTLAANNKKKIKVSFNSPAVLWFAIICLAVLVVQYITGDNATYYLFSVYRSSLLDPLTYVRFFGHALGHADIDHYMGNMMTLLIVGPLLEEKYGSKSIVLVMVVTAFVTGIVNFIFCPDAMTLGASGIVFAFILLSSLTCMKQGEIPLTFIVVAVLYLGEQVLEAALVESNISNISHIVGGICGCILGYLLNKNKLSSDSNGSSTNAADSNNNSFTYF